MSLQFNDTNNFRGIVQIAEKEMGKDRGYISGNSDRLKEFTADVNLAWDDYVNIAIKSSGGRQFDDSNYDDFPFIEMDLIANQRDYTYVTDDNGSLILDVYKVMVKNSSGVYEEVKPIDQQLKGQGVSIWDGQSITGTPSEYDKTGNGIIFDVLPNFSWRNGTEGEYGLKMFVNREASYFISTDTTKKPGCPGIHHRYFAIKPALDYARQNTLSNYNLLREEVVSFEGDEEKNIKGSIELYFNRRRKDERNIITMKKIKYI